MTKSQLLDSIKELLENQMAESFEGYTDVSIDGEVEIEEAYVMQQLTADQYLFIGSNGSTCAEVINKDNEVQVVDGIIIDISQVDERIKPDFKKWLDSHENWSNL